MQNVRGTAHLLALIGAIVWTVSMVWRPAPPPKYAGLGKIEERIPASIGPYSRGEANTFSKDVLNALAAADIVSYPYQSGTGWFDLTLIGGTDRSALHDPRSCLVGGGWKIENDHIETIPGTNIQARVCRATGGGKRAVDYEFLYVYVVGDQIINHVTQIRARMLMSALIGRKGTPVCFVRFQRPVPREGVDDPAEAARFRKFAGIMWNQLKVPGSI
ncbi:MAG: exosortase-associated EpsI family protein [Armatimonadota bacterium]